VEPFELGDTMTRDEKKYGVILPYDDIKSGLQTFDILNCVYGTEPWNPIHWIMGAIGHSAMVYRCAATGQLMVYESTQTSRRDKLSGVQLRPMKEWLNYPGRIYFRRTVFSDLLHRESALRTCDGHIQKYRGTAYPNLKQSRWLWFLINAAVDLPFRNCLENPDIDTVMFCTMLIGHVFRYCGMLADEKAEYFNPAEMEPDDLREDIERFVSFLSSDITVGPEHRLK